MPFALKNYVKKVKKRSLAENQKELDALSRGVVYLENLLKNAGEIPEQHQEYIEMRNAIELLEKQLNAGAQGGGLGRNC